MVERKTPGEKITAEARIWKDLREKLDRQRTGDVGSRSLERQTCLPWSLPEALLARSSLHVLKTTKSTVSFFENCSSSDL